LCGAGALAAGHHYLGRLLPADLQPSHRSFAALRFPLWSGPYRSHPINKPHSRAYLNHNCNAQTLERKLLIECAHLLCLKLNVQYVYTYC